MARPNLESVDDLKRAANGNILVMPLTGFLVLSIRDIAVLVALQYRERPEDIDGGEKLAQLALMPQQCLDLAEMLTRYAKQLLQPTTEKPN